jgi:hypothetical protein
MPGVHTLDRVARVHGAGLPIVSMSLATGGGVARVDAEPQEHLPAALLRSALPPIPDDMELQAR